MADSTESADAAGDDAEDAQDAAGNDTEDTSESADATDADASREAEDKAEGKDADSGAPAEGNDRLRAAVAAWVASSDTDEPGGEKATPGEDKGAEDAVSAEGAAGDSGEPSRGCRRR
ncbi:hypothetical protein ACQF36_42125 [Streptomyces sp. Marseille-Q5077]|uniref:hypothetical protein n=1 Tax=Streptomyces sp. Marseille-Q5077 TaxID=3418995 RepID=UPI003D0727A0